MRVALVTVGAGKGGVFNVVHQLALGLRERGHEPLIIADRGDQMEKLRQERLEHALAPLAGSFRTVSSARAAVRAALRRFRPDVVHSHSRWPSMVCLLAGRRPDVSTLHMDTLTAHATSLDRGPARRLLSVWGRVAVALDERSRQMLIRESGLAPERVVVIPNGVDPVRYAPPTPAQRAEARRRFGLGPDDPVAVFVGSMVHQKNPQLAVRALRAAVDAVRARPRMILVGGGDQLEPTKAEAERLGVADRCVFPGWVDPTDAYHAGDMLLLPSRFEGFGLVCVEAMLCGMPVVRTRRGGCDLQIVEGVTGWSAEVEDEAGLCNLVARALADPAQLASMGERARLHALDRFTQDMFLDRTIELYERVARPARGAVGGRA